MAKHKLHVGISLVYPRAHIGPHDGPDLAYLVLEPLLTEGGNEAIQAYFAPRHEHGKDGGESAAHSVFRMFEAHWITQRRVEDPCPVPLPPGVTVKFVVETGTPAIPARTIGVGGAPFGADLEFWPDVMQANSLTFHKFERGEDLWRDSADHTQGRVVTGDEFAALIDWGMARLQAALPQNVVPEQTSFPYLHELYNALKAPYETARTDAAMTDAPGPDTKEWWVSFLEEQHDGLDRAAIVWMLNKARHFARADEVERKRLSYPVFDYGPDEVRERLEFFFPESYDTFAELFWNEYRCKLEHWDPSKPEHARRLEQSVSELKRLMFLGERLFWPLPPGGDFERDVMLLPGDMPAAARGTNATGWRWTNNLSLFGHCFGVPRANLKDLRIRQILLGGEPVAGFNAAMRARFEDDLCRFAAEAEAARQGDKLRLSVDIPQAAVGSIGRIRFCPRLTTLDPDPTVPANYNGRLLTVPSPVLDALEGRAEWDMPKVEPRSAEAMRNSARFVRQTPQRTMVALTDRSPVANHSDKSELIPAAAQQTLFHSYGVVRLRATMRRLRVTGLRAMKVNGQAGVHYLLRFELDRNITGDGAPDDIHDGDLKEMKKWAASPVDARIWFGPSDAQEEAVLSPQLTVLPEAAELAFTVSVTLGEAGEFERLLRAFLDAEAAALVSPNDRERHDFDEVRGFSFPVELLFGVDSGAGTERFNALLLKKSSDEPHYIALGKAFDFTFLNGSEHLYRRFYLRHLYDEVLDQPWKELSERSRIGESFGGSIKAFVYLKAESPILPGHCGEVRLTQHDHLLPRGEGLLPAGEAVIHGAETASGTTVVEPGGTGRGYELLHSFTNVPPKRSSLSWDERVAAETPRFQFHALAGTNWRLQVRADSRFGFPHFGFSEDLRRLPLFSPVAHPASRLVPNGAKGKLPTPMLSFDFDREAGTDGKQGPERLRLRFNAQYFREILKGRERPEVFAEHRSKSRDPDMIGLRDIYETFLDLYTGIVHDDGLPYNRVKLTLELWNFDNRKRGAVNSAVAGVRTDTEFPSLVGSLAYRRSLDFSLVPPLQVADGDPRRELRIWLEKLLFGDGDLAFDQFCKRLAVTFEAPQALDKILDFPLLGRPAVWLDAATGSPYDGPAGHIVETTNLVRAGLDIERHAKRGFDAAVEVRESDLHPTLLEREKERDTDKLSSATGVPPWMIRKPDGTTPNPAPHKDEIGAVKRTAMMQLDELLRGKPLAHSELSSTPQAPLEAGGTKRAPSELRRRFEWLRVELPSGPPGKNDPQLPRRLLGPAYPYAKFLKGLRAATANERVRLFSVPVAFVQFPQIEPFKDRASSNEFVHYLFDILQSFCDGESPLHLPLEAHDVGSGTDGADRLLRLKAEAIELRRRVVRHLIRPEILAHVEDDEIVCSEGYEGQLRRWDGYRGLDHSSTVAAHKALLERVRVLRESLFNAPDGRARAVIGEMLERDLRLYKRAKAFALHLLDETDRVNNRMYSCILVKYIRQRLWLGADDVLQPIAIREALRTAAAGTDLARLRHFLRKNRDTRQELARLLELDEDKPTLQHGFARLFTFVIDTCDLQCELSGLNWEERTLDHWRIGRALQAMQSDDGTLRRRLVARRNRLILERILDEALVDRPFAAADKIDPDRFTFLNIHGEGDRRFLVDVLEDEDYDSEYEIAHHLASARSADDILENANDYGWLRNAASQQDARDDYGVDPGERNLELMVEPHNPEWREWQHPRAVTDHGFDENALERPVRWYYVLPSRTPPAQPLPLEVLDSVAGPSATPRYGSDLATRLDWRNRPQHVFPNAAEDPTNPAKLKECYESNYKDWGDLTGVNPVYLRDANSAGVPNRLNVEDRGSSTHKLYAKVSAKAYDRAIHGWHHVESYVAHYHFEVQPDEEATSGSLVDGFRNDNFRIEIEEYDIGVSPQQATAAKPAELGPQDGLVGWYQYYRSLDRVNEGTGKREVVPPQKMTAEDVFAELKKHLNRIEGAVPAFPTLVDDSATRGVKRRVARIALSGTDKHFSLLPTEKSPKAVRPCYGTLLDARLLSFPRDKEGKRLRAVLRLSLLCSAVFNYRVRVKVRRNFRDVDHDGDSDINPRFQLVGEASPWVALGHYTVLRTHAIVGSLPQALQQLRAAPGSVNRKTWFSYPTAQALKPGEFGDPLRYTMDLTSDYWGALREAPPDSDLHAHLVVTAIHLSARPDRTQPLHDGSENALRDPARDSYRPQAFGIADTKNLASLFDVAKADAPSVSKAFSFIWYYLVNKPEPGATDLGPKLPVLEVYDVPYVWPRADE